MNALKHGLRARTFGILPEEDKAEWAEHVRDLRAGYGPVDAAEEKLVTAIAVAMWNEIRADRTLVETMAEIPPRRAGRSCGTDLQEPEHARSLGTAIRYLTAAGMATQRAQRAFFQHRKAKRDGLILPAAEEPRSRPPIRMARTKTRPNPAAPSRCPPRPHPIHETAQTNSPEGTSEPESRSHPCPPASTACWPAPAQRAPRNGT